MLGWYSTKHNAVPSSSISSTKGAQLSSGQKWTEKQRAAHYKGLAEAAKNQKMFPGGGSKPPKKGCWEKLFGVFVLLALVSVAATAIVRAIIVGSI